MQCIKNKQSIKTFRCITDTGFIDHEIDYNEYDVPLLEDSFPKFHDILEDHEKESFYHAGDIISSGYDIEEIFEKIINVYSVDLFDQGDEFLEDWTKFYSFDGINYFRLLTKNTFKHSKKF